MARELRGVCRYHLLKLRILMPDEEIPDRYARLLDYAHRIGDLVGDEGAELARSVRLGVDALAADYGRMEASARD
ncbi:hypothetical protein CGZ93_05700 [Enemella dayhoffiae]|uniref:Uncharacterized protein n=2 Tax=Enemella dayhoffiae TaxID=2016507 RepID=A0A255H717_9ACTN|nr:hypothetical protein CGZ93_05700 [Enemella dayhoffiae]